MSKVIKITKPGKSVTSEVLNDFYFHSRYPLLKVHASGTFATLNDGTRRITHNLGYRPFAIVFSQFVDTDGVGNAVKSTEYYQHDWRIEGATVTYEGFTKIYENDMDITVGNSDVATPGAVNGIYYIFKDEL